MFPSYGMKNAEAQGNGRSMPGMMSLVLSSALLAMIPVQATHIEEATGVAAGSFYTCVLTNTGNVDCYGQNLYGEAADYMGGDAVGVSAGFYHTCILTSSGNVDCYGANWDGQAADYAGGDAVAVSAEFIHTCVLTSGGDVDCYGSNLSGEAEDYLGGDAVGVAAGGGYTCILRSGGDVDCYGFNGDGRAEDYLGGDAVDLATGEGHTCILRSIGNVDCYGNNTYGQAADYTGGDAIGVAAHWYHTCILKSGGNVDCYGLNDLGQSEDYLGGDAVDVVVGAAHTCILRSAGDVHCYGAGEPGKSGSPHYGQAASWRWGGGHRLLHSSHIPLTSSDPIPDEPLETPDYPGTDPVPTGDVGPLPVGPMGYYVGTLTVEDRGGDVCVDFTPEDSSAIPIACASRASLGPANAFVPRGETPVIVYDEEDPFVEGEDVPDIPDTDSKEIPDVEQGDLGFTPETSILVEARYEYEPDLLHRDLLLLGEIEVWRGVTPGMESWFVDNGGRYSLDITVTLFQDGGMVGTVPVQVPYLGQFLAAAEKSLGTLEGGA